MEDGDGGSREWFHLPSSIFDPPLLTRPDGFEDGAVQHGFIGRRFRIDAGDDGGQLQVIAGQHEAARAGDETHADCGFRDTHLRGFVDDHQVEAGQLRMFLQAGIRRGAEDSMLVGVEPVGQVVLPDCFGEWRRTLPVFGLAIRVLSAEC